MVWKNILVLTALLNLYGVWGSIQAPSALNLRITKNKTVDIPSTLYGYMWEDINQSGDGGLYAELLQNRAFQGVIPGTQAALFGWQPFQGAWLSVTSDTQGVSSALPNSLEVDIPSFVNGPIGFENTGYWGIKVQSGWTYTASFYAKSSTFSGSITASLTSSTTGQVFSTQTLKGINSKWKQFTFQFTPNTTAPDTENVFRITVNGADAQGASIFFGMFSLFPPTFRGRENGMRIDLAEAFAATRPSVWRFPGGNNLEGGSWDTRWKWNETIGPIENRPGRIGDWSYPNTDGLGLLEYLNWAEDLGAEPILGIWAGISIANYSELSSWPVVPEDELKPYVDDAINEIHFITDPAGSSDLAKLREQYGRKEPYALTFIEVGNEDQFQPDSYAAYRWNAFVSAISAEFPHLEFLATTQPSTALNPAYKRIDFHQYAVPQWFHDAAFMFDDYPRNGTKWFIGEYAVTSTNTSCNLGAISCGRLAFPTLEGAAAEAAFMTGMERNSDVVFASAYAPSLQHLRNFQWSPDIMSFTAGTLIKSASYFVQQMFSANRGTQVLETTPASTNDSFPLFWVASHNNKTNAMFLKVSNVGSDDIVFDLSFDFPVGGFGTAITLANPPLTVNSGVFSVANTPEYPEAIVPVSSAFAIVDPTKFNYTFPAQSVTVLSLSVKI
ncbi:glycoside hydrolase family 51 protein [Sphaerobolus stellatus SS14]|uniref:non-reducing end alpha-L-arabinofuranosidase n=1 Tax=Sphaerobolus stellatus (strain SS14) TaxID=990650 RepID=A0A0C9UNV7_SPHS4|nr:glycoside hydrolase family 51 protein [Sphaerobolus stellatus SS14]